jgi:hypothetical protein
MIHNGVHKTITKPATMNTACNTLKRQRVPDMEMGLGEDLILQEVKRQRMEHGYARIWIIICNQIKNWVNASFRVPL